MNLTNFVKSVRNAEGMVLGAVKAAKGIFSNKGNKSTMVDLGKMFTDCDLPKPPINANANILDFWVEPVGNYPMLSVSAMSKKDLFEAVSDVSKSLDISDDAEVWALVQWMKEVDKENLV